MPNGPFAGKLPLLMEREKSLPPCYAIIPARYESSRFPGKPLADILGVPMCVRVHRRAAMCARFTKVVIATDDARIMTQKDEYLYFNLGRLYYDWQKWDKMAAAAEKAAALNPNFAEARKLLAFAHKKLGA